MAMTLCGIPLLDQRSCRVDIATTLGEPVEWTIDFGEDVSGWTFSAGLVNPDGSAADVDPPNPPEPLVLDVSAAAAGIVTLSITGLATTEEPLGPGHWTWWLAAAVPPATEPSYLLGGDLGIYRVSSFASKCADTNQVIEVSVGPPTINADVSLFLPGGDVSGFVQKSGDTMTGPLILPANDAANQAARITAYDAATGRLALGGVEMGDTGWRVIASWTDGVQDATDQLGTLGLAAVTLVGTANLQMKRTRDQVIYRWTGNASNNMIVAGGGGAFFTANVIPPGFQAPSAGYRSVLSVRTSTLGQLIAQGSSANVGVTSEAAGDDLVSGEAGWSTPNDWPTSLPGTPA